MKDNKFMTYYVPDVSRDKIVWSVSTFKKKNAHSENGEIYLYDLNTKSCQIISKGDEMLHPRIYENYVVALRKPNGENEGGELIIYDISNW